MPGQINAQYFAPFFYVINQLMHNITSIIKNLFIMLQKIRFSPSLNRILFVSKTPYKFRLCILQSRKKLIRLLSHSRFHVLYKLLSNLFNDLNRTFLFHFFTFTLVSFLKCNFSAVSLTNVN